MRIENIKLGFATNSSSSHSIVSVPDEIKLQTDNYDSDYGWNLFTLNDRDSKINYLSATVLKNISKDDTYSSEMLKIILSAAGLNPNCTGDVDHQSLIVIPNEFGTQSPSFQYIAELKDILLNPKVAILGGNDNGDSQHPLLGCKGVEENVLPKNIMLDTLHCVQGRKDGDWWTLFNSRF